VKAKLNTLGMAYMKDNREDWTLLHTKVSTLMDGGKGGDICCVMCKYDMWTITHVIKR